MNKKIRRDHTMRKYIKRIKRWVRGLDIYICRNGEIIKTPKAIDVIKDNGQNNYRTTSTPCSCVFCSHSKYQRSLKRKNDYKLIQNRSGSE